MSASSSIGPISGINYGQLITGLTETDQAQIDAIGTRITALDSQNNALLSISGLLTGLKVSAASFTNSSLFRTGIATSNNTSVVNATAGIGTPVGTYNFNVQQLASASQTVTQGFADAYNNPLGLSGNVTVQLGGGLLSDDAKLSSLNGGNGVARGSVRITDGSGASSIVDLSHAVNIQDVVDTINSATGVNVVAKIDGDNLVINDNSGGTGTLTIGNAGGTTTASDLGLVGSATAGVLTGSSITKLSATSSLTTLNDGNGVRSTGTVTPDFTITGSGTGNISLNGATTLGDVVTKINAQTTATGVTAQISSDGHGLTLTNAGGGPITVTAQNNSLAASDLGILGTSASSTLTGSRITSGLSGPLLSDLNGGNQGQAGATLPQPGTITINGNTVDLSNDATLTDVIKSINNSGQGVTASLDNAGTGLTLSSTSNSFTVADGTGNLASFLHIAGTSTTSATGSQIASGDLRLRYISNNTLLSSLNGGTGFKPGTISITDGTGANSQINLSGTGINTIGDVINAINNSGLKIAARVNNTGDGILLTQTGGLGTASVADTNGGTTAASLGIAGTFSSTGPSAGTLNGSFQKTVTILPTDKLSDIATKFNNANLGIAATIINDGSGATPFRLSLASRNSGYNGRIVINGSAAGLTQTSLVQGQDAAVVYGGNSNGTGGLLAVNSTNTFTGLVANLSLSLTGVGSTSVTVNSDTTKISTAISSFVDAYNQVVNNITTATAFDPNNSANNGVLFGNSVTEQVTDALGLFVTTNYSSSDIGQLKNLTSVGITVNQDGTLTLDSDALNTALTTDPADVQSLFTTNVVAKTGGPTLINNTTLLNTLGFVPGSIQITDGAGTLYTVDLSTAKNINDVITKINAKTNGKVTAALNSTGNGIQFNQAGGSGTASISEVNGGTTAASLNIKGALTGGILNNIFPPTFPTVAQKGIGQTLSDVLTRFTDAQTGVLFDASNSLQTQEQELTDNQTSLAQLLTSKKNQLIQTFANLEVSIAGFQSQGSALASLSSSTTSSSTA